MEDKGNNRIFGVIWTIVFVMVAFSSGYALRGVIPGSVARLPNNLMRIHDDTPRADMSLYWEVWNTLRDEYVDAEKYDSEEMLYGSIKGLVNSYDDPATIYLDPEETKEFDEQSAGRLYEGIGAELGKRNGLIRVVTPIKGSPAEEAGLRAGDAIYQIDGEEVKSTDTIYEVVTRIRGEAGTTVTLTVLRAGESGLLDIPIVRGKIVVPSVVLKKPSDYGDDYGQHDNNIAIISVSRFTDESPAKWESVWSSVVDQVVAGGYDKVIVDLRNNPGGFFSSAIYALDEFTDRGELLAMQSDRHGNSERFVSTRKGRLLDVDMVVIVNGGSASASEIFAGAIQHYDIADVLGESTYGKGTAQVVIPFSDNSSLHITTIKWLLPDGQWISPDHPVVPDVELEIDYDEYDGENDLYIAEAIDNLLR